MALVHAAFSSGAQTPMAAALSQAPSSGSVVHALHDDFVHAVSLASGAAQDARSMTSEAHAGTFTPTTLLPCGSNTATGVVAGSSPANGPRIQRAQLGLAATVAAQPGDLIPPKTHFVSTSAICDSVQSEGERAGCVPIRAIASSGR